MAQELPSPAKEKQSLVVIPKVTADSIICFTDAAWRADIKATGLGWVFKNQADVIVAKRHVGSALIAEGMAVLEALKYAKDFNCL